MIRLSKSVVGEKEAAAVSKVLKEDGYLGMGKTVQKFELEIENYLSAKTNTCCCVNSGTSALQLAVESVTNPGDHVLVPSFTYVATYQAISAAGCIPISCDVLEDSFLLDLNDVKKRIDSRCKALIYVHYASNPGNLDELYSFGKSNNLRIIEDAAHSFGCSYKEKKIGSFGDITCFSFDGIKNITSGEGGAILTEDQEVLSFARDARLLGVIKDTDKRYLGERSWNFDVKKQGYRFHMSNIFAAIGLVQLDRLKEEFTQKRIKLKELYLKLLSNNSTLTFQKTNVNSYIIPHIMPERIGGNKRDKIFNELKENNIGVGLHYKPNHLLSFYKNKTSLKITEILYREIISLPLHPDLSEDDVKRISQIINKSISI